MSKVTKVFKYGLLPPTLNGDLVRQQMKMAHAYRNELVWIERGRRAAVRSIYAEHGSEPALERAVEEAEAAVDEAERAIKERRAETRSRSEKQSQRDALKEARERLKRARAELGAYRRTLRSDPEIVEKLAAIDGAKKAAADGEKVRDNSTRNDGLAAQLRRSARANAVDGGLYWGTYLLIEGDDGKARTAPFYRDGKPNDPGFMRWDGSGRVGVQIQRQSGDPPFGPAELFGSDTRVRVNPVDERAWTSPVRGERRRLSRTVLHLRIGSDGRAPVWASWPMIMHRPLPEGSVIKWVVVNVRRVGPREEWTCDITVDIPEAEAVPSSGTRCSAVAVHLGWLQTERGLRVATWMDTTGEAGSIVLGDGGALDLENAERGAAPTMAMCANASESYVELDGGKFGVMSGIRKANDLRSIRDKNLDAARDALVAWLREHDMPEWMRAMTVRRGAPLPSKAQALAYLSGWESSARLAALAIAWASRPFTGDEIEYWALETWRYHDYHLWEWESSQRLSALRRRREVYRRAAAELAKRYSTVLIDGVKLDGIARRPKTEDDGDSKAARANRHAAAVSELRLVLENAVRSRGGTVVKIDVAGLSITCPECGAQDPSFKHEREHKHACSWSEFDEDLDYAARLNMLRRGGFGDAADGIIERMKAKKNAKMALAGA